GEGLLRKTAAQRGRGAVYQYARGCLGSPNGCARGTHPHLQCTNCGATACMDCAFAADIEQHTENEHDFSLDSAKTVIYGVCRNCRL
ncbi:MAG: hypothetical protein FWE80_10100, partial [Oscillospiraceae bacterium]|nr:hypothetical protein [Oscillospiraceae bacterium]